MAKCWMTKQARACWILKMNMLLTFGILTGILTACSISPPEAPPFSKNLPAHILKFVPYSQNDSLVGYFTLADQSTNQVAAAGSLKIYLYTSRSLSLSSEGQDTKEGMKMKTVLYDQTFAIGATNFHWETFGSIFRINDLAVRFAIPYSHFKAPVRRGQVVNIQIDFRPDGGTNLLSSIKIISLY